MYGAGIMQLCIQVALDCSALTFNLDFRSASVRAVFCTCIPSVQQCHAGMRMLTSRGLSKRLTCGGVDLGGAVDEGFQLGI